MTDSKATQSRLAERRERTEALSDADLVAACVEGDHVAWETVVRRYRRLVYAIPSRAGMTYEQTEWVFHETFAKLAEKIATLRDRARLQAWIVTTARRLTIDCMRQRKTRPTFDSDEAVLERVEDERPLAPEMIEDVERNHQVRRALQLLQHQCRQLITRLFYHASDRPPSYEEVARELDLPIGSIGPTRARCLEKLRVAFKEIAETE